MTTNQTTPEKTRYLAHLTHKGGPSWVTATETLTLHPNATSLADATYQAAGWVALTNKEWRESWELTSVEIDPQQ